MYLIAVTKSAALKDEVKSKTLTATAGHLSAGVAALPGVIWAVTASLKHWDLERSLEAFGAELTELAAAWQLR